MFRETQRLMYKNSNSFGYKIVVKFPGFLNNSISVYTIKLKLGMLYQINNTFRKAIFQISINVPLNE